MLCHNGHRTICGLIWVIFCTHQEIIYYCMLVLSRCCVGISYKLNYLRGVSSGSIKQKLAVSCNHNKGAARGLYFTFYWLSWGYHVCHGLAWNIPILIEGSSWVETEGGLNLIVSGDQILVFIAMYPKYPFSCLSWNSSQRQIVGAYPTHSSTQMSIRSLCKPTL